MKFCYLYTDLQDIFISEKTEFSSAKQWELQTTSHVFIWFTFKMSTVKTRCTKWNISSFSVKLPELCMKERIPSKRATRTAPLNVSVAFSSFWLYTALKDFMPTPLQMT
jgi:hypothetical protein